VPEATDADRDRASLVWGGVVHVYAEHRRVTLDHVHLTEAIARALADERERAVAPFLALADQFAEREDAASIWSAVARLIRHAAQEDPK
jgi:hypothetical protein